MTGRRHHSSDRHGCRMQQVCMPVKPTRLHWGRLRGNKLPWQAKGWWEGTHCCW